MFKAQQVKTRNCKIAALYLELLTHSMVQSPSLEVDTPLDNKYITYFL
jgi:hypothetical protein